MRGLDGVVVSGCVVDRVRSVVVFRRSPLPSPIVPVNISLHSQHDVSANTYHSSGGWSQLACFAGQCPQRPARQQCVWARTCSGLWERQLRAPHVSFHDDCRRRGATFLVVSADPRRTELGVQEDVTWARSVVDAMKPSEQPCVGKCARDRPLEDTENSSAAVDPRSIQKYAVYQSAWGVLQVLMMRLVTCPNSGARDLRRWAGH